jgi:hypothetical protein
MSANNRTQQTAVAVDAAVDQQSESVKSMLQVAVDQSTVILANAVNDVKEQVNAYDQQYQVSSTAASYVNPAVDRAQQTLTDLRTQADRLRTQTVAVTEMPIAVVTEQLNRAVNALAAIKSRALAFDEQHGGYAAQLSDRVKASRDAASAALADILAQVHKLQTDLQSQTVDSVNQLKSNTLTSVQGYYDAVKVTVAQQAEFVVNHPLPQSVKSYTEQIVQQTRERYNNAALTVRELPVTVETKVTGYTQSIAQSAEAKAQKLIVDAVAAAQQYENDHKYIANIRQWDADHLDLTTKTQNAATTITGHVEQRYHVVDRVSGLVNVVAGYADTLDTRYAITDKLQTVDNKVTGGVGVRAVTTGHSYVLSGLSSVVNYVKSSAASCAVVEAPAARTTEDKGAELVE